jgi:type IV secretory pathway VirB10-like protein
MNEEDITTIESAGRRCAVCRSGRHWREFDVVRAEGRDPVVLCPACHARYGETPPLKAGQEAPAPPVPEPKAQNHNQPQSQTQPQAEGAAKQRPRQQEDRLKKALRELPRGEHSTGRIAKAAGLNHSKTLGRLHQLEAAGEVRQVGKLWTTERPSTDLEGAFDRLQARTSNLRIIREKAPVG